MASRDQSVDLDGIIDIKDELPVALSDDCDEIFEHKVESTPSDGYHEIVDNTGEESFSDETADDDFTYYELPAAQRKESKTSSGTESILEGVRRASRLPSTLPAPNRYAEKARQTRKRKREYIETLEKELVLAMKENEEIRNVVKKQTADIILLKLRITKLQSFFDGHPSISKALKSFDENLNLENTAGTCLNANPNRDSPEFFFSSQTSSWNSEESFLDEVINTKPDASCEPAADERGESNTAETVITPKGIQSTSKLPRPTENSQKAREHRQRRKAYIEKLEKEFEHIENQNGHNSKVIEKLKADIMRSRGQFAYLESVLNNYDRVIAVLKSMNLIPSEDDLQVESLDGKLEDIYKLSAKRREKSDVSRRTKNIQEGVRRGRLPSKLPTANENAKKAREYRRKQKENLEKLEKELELAKKKKEEISNDIKTYDIKSWRNRVTNLQAHLDKHPSISALLKLMNANRSQSLENTVGICLHVTRSGVSLELCVSCQGKSLISEGSLRVERFDAVSDASLEPATKRKRVLSNISAETNATQEGTRRRGRCPSTSPALTSNAIVARENRAKKKHYQQTLENELGVVRQKKEDIRKVFKSQETDIMRMKAQIAYLESVRNNQPGISALLKYIDAIQSEHDFFQSRKNNAGFCLHVNGNTVLLEFCAHCHMKNFKGM